MIYDSDKCDDINSEGKFIGEPKNDGKCAAHHQFINNMAYPGRSLDYISEINLYLIILIIFL